MAKKCNKITIKAHTTKENDAKIINEELNAYNFDIRDKRISIIFKIIYVISALFISSFLYITNYKNVLCDKLIIGVGVTSFLFCLLVYLLLYVINELNCLRIGEKFVDKLQLAKTEDSYSFIFTYFYIGGIVHIFLVILLGLSKQYSNETIIYAVNFICIILASTISNSFNKNRIAKIVSSVFWCISSFCTFTLTLYT